MQYVGHRITFLQTFGLVCALCLAAACVVLLTPRDTAALNLSQTLKQLAKVKDSLKPKTNNGHKTQSFSSSRKQSEGSSTSVVASEPTPAPQPASASQPEATTTLEAAVPVQQALPPVVEPVASIASIPSRQQLLALVSEPLMVKIPFNSRTVGDYASFDSFAVLRPSAEGWKFLGIPWLWWVAGSATVWLGSRILKLRS